MNSMSAEEYQRTVCAPARKEAESFDPWLRKLMKTNGEVTGKLAKRAKEEGFKLPVKIVEGRNTLKSFKGLVDPDKPERQHIEDEHTEMVAGYLDFMMSVGSVVEYTHTANETYTRSPMQKARNTKMGVRSGIPDMVVVFKRVVLFLELKRPVGGVVSPTQKKWIAALRGVGGAVRCEVANGFDEAKKIIDDIAASEGAKILECKQIA